MIDRESIIQFIKRNGLVLPVHLSREFRQDTIIIGAMLSELAQRNLILISNAKIGGSPAYYVKENSYKLQELYKHLNEKDQRAYDLLKQRQVLRDRDLTPLLRVSLRNIKDFAKPIKVSVGEQEEVFWRWYLLSMDEAGQRIRSYFAKPEPQAAQQTKTPEQTEQPKNTYVASKPQDSESNTAKQQLQEQTVLKPLNPDSRPVQQEQPIMRAAIAETGSKDKQSKLTEPKEPENLDPEDIKDKLHTKIKKFFNKKEIDIRSVSIIRKNSEIEYTIAVPSPIGPIPYYCKVKSKKNVNDSDLAAAYVRGQMKKLPVLFITTGNLTKKTKEMLGSEFENLKVVKIN